MRSRQINNRSDLKDRRRELRRNLTPAEATLWTLLKDKKLAGYKFRRQHSIGNFILDFYCPLAKLAVELDGQHHFTEEGMRKDQARTKYLNGVGVRVLRFENDEVFCSPEAVLADIARHLNTNPTFPS